MKKMNSPRVIEVADSKADGNTVDEVGRILDGGGLVVAPTETRYGLLARADDPAAIAKLFTLKQRPIRMPMAIFIESVDEILRFGRNSETAERLAAAFLPGPLTLVLEAVEDCCPSVVVDGKIGLRLSSNPFIAALVKSAPFPITATSANLSGSPDLDSIDRISLLFGAGVQLYLDAGNLKGNASTVVDCGTEIPVVLREGAISSVEIMAAAKVPVS